MNAVIDNASGMQSAPNWTAQVCNGVTTKELCQELCDAAGSAKPKVHFL
jgi:hypothetical protein